MENQIYRKSVASRDLDPGDIIKFAWAIHMEAGDRLKTVIYYDLEHQVMAGSNVSPNERISKSPGYIHLYTIEAGMVGAVLEQMKGTLSSADAARIDQALAQCRAGTIYQQAVEISTDAKSKIDEMVSGLKVFLERQEFLSSQSQVSAIRAHICRLMENLDNTVKNVSRASIKDFAPCLTGIIGESYIQAVLDFLLNRAAADRDNWVKYWNRQVA